MCANPFPHEEYNTQDDSPPTPLTVMAEAIPTVLRDIAQWVVWRYEKKDGRWTKVPYQARASHSIKASVSDSKTWASFGAALTVYQQCGYAGVGFVLTNGDPYIGVDLDDCIDTSTGDITAWAQEIVNALPTYWEQSPSGKGLRSILTGTLPEGRRRDGDIEIYDTGRFLTITGAHFWGMPETIEELTAEVSELHGRIFAKQEPKKSGSTSVLMDEQIIQLASQAVNGPKFRALWAGDIGGYTSASEADAALCSMLAFYTQDEQQIDRLVSQSGLNREKWQERADYRRRTIALALSGLRERYAPPIRAVPPSNNSERERSGQDTTGARSANSARSSDGWPDPPGQAAYAGLAGRFVGLADEYTEADPVGILGHFLTTFGCAVGRGPHAMVGATRHDPRLFLGIVGKSSKARKGDSMMPVRTVFQIAEPDFVMYRMQNGLASGEGLISAIRDASSDSDNGVSDKRLLVVEPEFARLLTVMSRQGNTLNAVVRDAWDRGNLQSMTKNAPLRATGAHISIIGHITIDELRRELSDTDTANGFANRFMFLSVRRSKLLPEPGIFGGAQVDSLASELAECLEFASSTDCIVRDDEARELWASEYTDLSAERDGLVGSVLARAEAQVLRLSLIYALLDRSDVVRLAHLQSALELWRYSERCADYIFGDATGDRVADEVLRSLKQRGRMSRTEIYNLFGRHVASARIGLALELLSGRKLAAMKMEETGGRPLEVWEAI